MNTDQIAQQLFICIMEGIDNPWNQRAYTDREKFEIIENLIESLQQEIYLLKESE